MKKDPFIDILKDEFSRKKDRNAAYSLRAFSRDLAVDVSNLSKFLSYQITPGLRIKKKLASKLGFEEKDFEQLFSTAPSLKIQDKYYKNHSLEVFQVISNCYHYVILELFKLNDFKPTPKSISDKLNMSIEDVDNALKRLEKVGLLKNEKGRLIPADETSSSILNMATSRAHRDQQRQILEGSIDALSNTPVELRSQSSMTMAIDSRKLPEAKVLIKKFRREMGKLLSASQSLDEVYQLSISLYPVSKINKISNNKTKELS